MDVVEFLRQRLDEEEVQAQLAQHGDEFSPGVDGFSAGHIQITIPALKRMALRGFGK